MKIYYQLDIFHSTPPPSYQKPSKLLNSFFVNLPRHKQISKSIFFSQLVSNFQCNFPRYVLTSCCCLYHSVSVVCFFSAFSAFITAPRFLHIIFFLGPSPTKTQTGGNFLFQHSNCALIKNNDFRFLFSSKLS